MKRISCIFLSQLLTFLWACNNNEGTGAIEEVHSENEVIPRVNYGVVKTHPHDTTAFTEGLLVHNGLLYESTGSPGDMPQTRSLFGNVDLATGKILTKAELDRKEYFGEGISFLGGKIYQLTYQHNKGFIYDATTFKKIGEFPFQSKEGWGMTTDGHYLIMSDGTDILTYLDPVDFKTIKTLNVRTEKGPVAKINELEFINKSIYANIYETNTIIKIDTSTGRVSARLELGTLASEAKNRYRGALEMNGIAYDSISGNIYITGKMWPTLYEIQFTY